MKCHHLLAALAILSTLLTTTTAYAQSDPAEIPPPLIQEILIKTTILTVNDANVTGNYTVLYSRLSTVWQKQTSPEKLAELFKNIRAKHEEYWRAAVSPVSSKTAEIMPNGLLRLTGELSGLMSYDFKYIIQDGDWAIVGIGVSPPSKK